MIKRTLAVLSFALVGAASVAHASEDYGPAGCGLGSLVFEKEGKFQQILASTTNGTFGSQTFGISSGTSNCEKGGKLGALKVREFVASNRAQIETEAAKGAGEGITTLAAIMNCKDEAAVAANLKNNFSSVFTSSTNNEVGKNAATSISVDPIVQASCTI